MLGQAGFLSLRHRLCIYAPRARGRPVDRADDVGGLLFVPFVGAAVAFRSGFSDSHPGLRSPRPGRPLTAAARFYATSVDRQPN